MMMMMMMMQYDDISVGVLVQLTSSRCPFSPHVPVIVAVSNESIILSHL